jgi:hypothetical protein
MHTSLTTKTTTTATTATTTKAMAMATLRVGARNQGNEDKGSTYMSQSPGAFSFLIMRPRALGAHEMDML